MQTRSNTPQDCTLGITPNPQSPWRLKSVKALPGFRLEVTFLDGLHGYVDLSRKLSRDNIGVFVALKDPAVFNQVHLEYGVATWPGEIDIAPDAMHEEIKKHGEWILK